MASSLARSESAALHIVCSWEAIGEGMMRGGFMARPEEEIISYVEQVKQQHSQNLNILISKTNEKLGSDNPDYIKPEIHLLKGMPRSTIPEFAGEIKADLVVMGTVARTGLAGFIMGNTAETILNQLNCSVLAIKPPGFKSPVVLED
jgi:nucleotide-binding universal stress UspA family protein